MKEYDLFVPLFYNDGRPVEPQVFQALQQQLLQQFGGLTSFPNPAKVFGRWLALPIVMKLSSIA